MAATTVSSVRAVPWRQWCERMMRWAVRERYARQLCHANLAHWHVADLWALRLVSGFCVGLAVLMFGFGLLWTIAGVIVGWALIGVWLAQRIKEQQRLLTSQLPAFLDLLSMSLSAGMNLQTAVQLVLGFQAKTALANLWRTWLLQVRSGTARIQAFKQMLDRVQSPALRRICVALIQAEQSGSGMAASLQAHSHQLRQERMMNAEKQALKAPVKMLLPLVVCFFPSTFLVLGFSIYINMGDLI
ncbi:MAG: type II secretion system F family protein [Burkholderiaceae bacterium]|nr:type II secretion system F family protein [Burkholderiaceae bacterium]